MDGQGEPTESRQIWVRGHVHRRQRMMLVPERLTVRMLSQHAQEMSLIVLISLPRDPPHQCYLLTQGKLLASEKGYPGSQDGKQSKAIDHRRVS